MTMILKQNCQLKSDLIDFLNEQDNSLNSILSRSKNYLDQKELLNIDKWPFFRIKELLVFLRKTKANLTINYCSWNKNVDLIFNELRPQLDYSKSLSNKVTDLINLIENKKFNEAYLVIQELEDDDLREVILNLKNNENDIVLINDSINNKFLSQKELLLYLISKNYF